jgi:hypothetical protein
MLRLKADLSRVSFVGALLVALCFMVSTGAPAQTSQGFTGLVTDSSGAAIPNAKVIVHNEGSAVDKMVTTTGTGNWAVPFLDPGTYDVSVTADKFKTVLRTGITLVTGQTAAINISLPIGSVTETVTVNTNSEVLDYDKADRGNVIENKQVEELPVNTGDTFNLAILSPGVTTTTTGTTPGNQSAQTLGIHGAGVQFSIDGVTNQSETGPEHYTYAPPVEALQEFKITTNAFDAANGRSPGGQIDMTLKTGTKKLHGAVYEDLQRAFLNANTPQNDANIARARSLGNSTVPYNKGANTQNQYGFELDGPVILPKIWGATRQTFFTILYEDIAQHAVATATTSVPTTAMINGDFSGLLNQTVAGKPYNGAIYDPASEAACTANNTDTGTTYNSAIGKALPHVCRYQFGYGPGAGAGSQGNPVLIGTPNVIPANRLIAVAQGIMSWYPAPNATPIPTVSNPFGSNYVGPAPSNSDNKTYLIKIDQYVGERDSFDATGKLWKYYGQANNAFPRNNVNAAHPGLNEAEDIAHYNGTDYRYPSVNASWTHTFNPTVVNIVRGLVTTALESDSTGPASGYDPSNLGFSSNIGAANPTYFQRFPLTNISNFNALGSQAVLFRGDDELQISDTVNWTHGNHVMHFGGEGYWTQYSQKSSNNLGLSLSIGNAWTDEWDTSVAGTGTATNTSPGTLITVPTAPAYDYSGNSIASMLLGTWDSGSATTAGGNYFSSHYAALYFQDDWKVRPNLTLNLGVRWENPGQGLKDRFNRFNSVFDFNDVNPITQLIPAATLAALPVNNVLLGGVTYAGVNGNSEWEFKPVYWDFGPRAGFAYTVNPKTVVRGGMGLSFNDQATGNQNAPNQYGYSTSTGYTGSTPTAFGSSTLITPLNNMANPFPTFQTASGNCGGNLSQCLETNAGQGVSFQNPNYHPAEYLGSSLSVERALTSRDTIEVAYAGTRAYGMAYSDDLNHISPNAQAACDPLRGGNGLNCSQAYGSTPAAGTSVAYIQNPFYQLAPFAASGAYYTNSTIQKTNFTRPYPIFGAITENLINGGKFWYNGIEAIYNHRTAHGLTLNINYNHSKAMSASGYVDTVNRIPSRQISGVDIPNQFSVSSVYQLPIARGRGFFPEMPRYLDLVVGGWQVAGIYRYQSGAPIGMQGWIINTQANGGDLLPRQRFWAGSTNPWFPSLPSNGNNYIQRMKPCVATVNTTTGALQPITQTAALITSGLCSAATPNFIQVPSNGATPNNEYTGIRFGPNNQLDANLAKNFDIVKGIVFQMRIDAFNVLNHIQQTSSGFDTSTSDGFFGTYQLGTSGGSNYNMRYIQIDGRLSW